MQTVITSTNAQTAGKYLNSQYFDNHIPKNPQSSPLGSFGSVPVNYYTGLPEISIPLFSLKGRELEVPVGLNYDASGIRTDEFSGPVGIKWNLDAGGFVVRELNGRPDEHPTQGYLKYSNETNYYQNLGNTHDWVGYSERNERDCEFDEFTISINGRSIRFVLNKHGQAITIPRQSVNITPTIVNNKINKFEVVTEDGIKYVFGGSASSVEERKTETLNIGFAIDFDPLTVQDLPNNRISAHTFYKGDGGYYATNVTNKPPTLIEFYNSKWYLVSIIAPTQETTSFVYQKSSDLIYAARPSTVRVKPLTTQLPSYTYTESQCVAYCGLPWEDRDDFTFTAQGISAIVRFNKTQPGSGCEMSSCPTDYLPPDIDVATPGSSNSYHTIITESNIRLLSITSATGASVSFESSSRTDLPGTMKYDKIILKDFNGQIVKSIKLNFATVDAAEGNSDYFWLGEALMMKRIGSWSTTPDNYYYAHHLKQYSENQIPDVLLRKYVFEGLKDYNYKRLFLESIDDITGTGTITAPILLYQFEYFEREKLRRRTTPLHDRFGYTRTNSTSIENYPMDATKKARVANAKLFDIASNRVPISGVLNKIIYPTGGFTKLTYSTLNAQAFKLKLIEDRDGDINNTLLTVREIVYLNSYPNARPINGTFEEFKKWGTDYWMKYQISSTSALNSYILTRGAVDANDKVQVFNGSVSNNKGFEIIEYYSPFDFPDGSVNLTSDPPELDANNNLYDINNDIFPFPKSRDRDYLRGMIQKHQFFAKGANYLVDVPLKETAYEYDVNPSNYVPANVAGFKGGSFNYATHGSIDSWKGWEVDVEVRYRYARYGVNADLVILNRVKETTPDQTNLLKKQTKVTDYFYDPTYLQLVETKTYDENYPSESIINKTKYVTHNDYIYPKSCYTDYTACRTACQHDAECLTQCIEELSSCVNETGSTETAAIIKLNKTHQISTPVEVQTWVEQNGLIRLISSIAYKYKKWGTSEFVKPSEVWGLKQALDQTQPSPDYVESWVNNSGTFLIDQTKMRKLHTFDSYDLNKGNILQQTTLDGTVSTYQWDPASTSIVTTHIVNPGTTQHANSYAHIPSVGPSSVTDPNGITKSFEYDAFKRLKLVKDDNDKILSRYRYHYVTDKEAELPDFTIGGSPYVGSTVTFSTPGFYNGYGSNTYSWKYGDGTENTGGSTAGSRAYTTPGAYTVHLSISNPERNPITVSKQITIHPQLTVSICADGPEKFQKSTGTVFNYGSCTTTNNTPNSTTFLKSTVNGGCPPTGYIYQWQFQQINSCGTGPWVSLGTASQVTAPAAFINRTMGPCGAENYDIRLTVTDPCGKTTASSVLRLSVF